MGTEEIWEIVNQSGMDHPWHQHVNDGQVIAKWGSVTLRLPIRDHGGMTMFHCHILEHEDIGMMGMWHIDGDGMPMPM